MNNLRLPSVEKPWMKLFEGMELPKEEDINRTLNSFLWKNNEGGMDDVAIEYFGRLISFGEMKENVWQLARAMKKNGVKKGDIVTICAVMLPEIIYMFYALELLGATPNMVDPRTSTEGIHDYIEEAKSKICVTLSVAYPKIKKSVLDTEVEKVVVVSPADSLTGIKKVLYKAGNKDKNVYENNVVMWKPFFETGRGMKDEFDYEDFDPNHPALIVHTGGTTGNPKGVMLGAVALNALAAQYALYGYKRKQKFLNVMPPFIAYGYACGVHLPLSRGVRTILIPAFEPKDFGNLLTKHKANHIAGVPLHYQTLARDPGMKGKDLSFLMSPGVGGDAITTGAEIEVNEFFKAHGCKSPLMKGYGMTELASTTTTCTPDHSKLGSVGFPLALMTVGIFDVETGKELTYGEEGEICATGPNLMLGYYEKEFETRQVLKKHEDGKLWMHTGDVGIIDEDGYVFIRSRVKRLIIRHDGFKLFPSNIENVISNHPGVKTCSAVGVDDPEHIQGRLPAVFIVCDKESGKSEDEIIAEVREICQKELAEYSQPLYFVGVEELPYTGIGKVDYRTLEERAASLA